MMGVVAVVVTVNVKVTSSPRKRSVTYRASGLTQGRLNQACGDEATRLPRGLTIPHC